MIPNEEPPSESESSRVNLESRYGIRDDPSFSALTTLANANKDVLIEDDSVNLTPYFERG